MAGRRCSGWAGMHAELIAASRARKSAKRLLIGKNQDATGDALRMEALLGTLWPLAHQRIGQFVPVHYNKLANRARSMLALLFPDSAAQDQSRAIDHLAMLGAIARLANGYFLPAPLRWVNLKGRGAWALIGGVPTCMLPHDIRATLGYDHLLRVTEGDPDGHSLSLPIQSLESWIGKPREPLGNWTQSIIRLHLERAGEVTRQAIGDYEIYMPNATSNTHQHWRWQDISKLEPSTVYLARITSRFKYRKWGLVASDDRRGCRFISLDLARVDPRRLMYGFDALAHRATSATIEPRDSSVSMLTLGSELPDAERRFLLAIGHVTSQYPDRYYPLVWTFPTNYEQDVRTMLTSLHIDIKVTR